MPRGQSGITKVHYKGETDDFIVMVDSAEELEKWKGDKSVPLVEVVSSFQVFTTGKHGTQGEMNTASKSTLENEFGTKNEEEAVKIVLEKGTVQVVENNSKHPGRGGDRNETQGPRQAH